MSFGQWPSDYLGVPLEERFNFNPLTYFLYSGIDGAWFDPEDMSTMYQDTAGTIPVTAMEQPVGLWLDKSQGLLLGPELVANGVFDVDTAGWEATPSVGTEIAAVSGELVVTNITNAGTNQANYNLLSSVQTGRCYIVSVYARKGTSDGYQIIVDGSTITLGGSPIKTNTTNEKSTLIFKMLAGQNCTLRMRTIGVGAAYFDNISVRELKGNHATQSITASRPTLSARYNQLLNSATLSTQSVITVAAQYTLSFTGTGSVTLSGTATGTLAGTGVNNRVSLAFTPTAGTLTMTVTGSVTLAMLAFGALTTYQAITTATKYDSVGWPRYLYGDGIDDFYDLPFMNLANSIGGVTAIFAADNMPQNKSVAYILSEKTTGSVHPIYGLAYMTSASNQKSFITDSSGSVKYDAGFSKPKSLAQINSIVDTKSNLKNYLNGVRMLSVDYTPPVVMMTNNETIFASRAGSVAGHIQLKLYGLIITKSALSNTDRQRCEKFLASRLTSLGVTLS